MPTEADQPQTRTFAEGIEYIRRNHEHDDWFLQIETFDPHEPFFTHRDRKDRFAGHYDRYAGRHFDWPVYRTVNETPEEIEHCRYEYASLLNMCDARLGDVLDLFDELNLWDDTMLVVWTDHGFLLGEHDSWAKCWLPFYEEVAHTPFFVWDPRSRRKGERCDALVQPSIDLGPTLLEAFGQPVPDEMLGKPLGETLASGAPVREAGVFGMFGMAVNLVEGPHVYMRGPVTADNTPLNDYTLMPTNMHHTFSPDLMRSGRISLAEPFSFTQGCATMRIPNQGYNWDDTRPAPQRIPTLLFDVEQDPLQRAPIDDPAVEQRLAGRIVELMKQCDAPPEQYERLGLAEPARG